jgi:hypothetical protein
VGNWKVGFASISPDAFFERWLQSGVLTRVSHGAVREAAVKISWNANCVK